MVLAAMPQRRRLALRGRRACKPHGVALVPLRRKCPNKVCPPLAALTHKRPTRPEERGCLPAHRAQPGADGRARRCQKLAPLRAGCPECAPCRAAECHEISLLP